MDKNHLPFWGERQSKNNVSQAKLWSPALHRPAPVPRAARSFSARQHIPLPALQLSSDTPAAPILLTPQALHNLPVSLFLLLLHLRDAASALGELSCEEMTTP